LSDFAARSWIGKAREALQSISYAAKEVSTKEFYDYSTEKPSQEMPLLSRTC
jgi:hypothetical protein